MITIGIDIGTTTISGAVLAISEDAARLLHAENIPNDSFLPPDVPGARIQDAERILSLAKGLLDRLLNFCCRSGPSEISASTGIDGGPGETPAAIGLTGPGEISAAIGLTRPGEIPAAIGLTGQMHGIVYTDCAGRPLSPLYTWQDQRGETVREQILEKTGISVPGGYGFATHYYNMIHGLVPKGAVSLCTIMDLFGMRLTGNSRPLMHSSNAASLGLFHPGRNHYLKESMESLFGKAEVSATGGSGASSFIPDFSEEIREIGHYHWNPDISSYRDSQVSVSCHGIPVTNNCHDIKITSSCRSIPVTCAIGDNQAGVLASVGTAPGTPLVNFGTGGQVSLLTTRYSELPGIETRPFLPGLYLMAGSSLCGGRAYAILERFFRSYAAAAGAQKKPQYAAAAGAPEKPQYELMNALAEKALQEKAAAQLCREKETAGSSTGSSTGSSIGSSSEFLSVSPLFCGTREDPSVRGSVTGISENNFTPGALILGTLRGMTDELYGYYSKMTSSQPDRIKPDRVVGSGNGLRKNPVLQKLVAELFGAPLELSPFEEEAACGAAISAAMALTKD